MPWIKKVMPTREDLHKCKLPDLYGRSRHVHAGSIWQCRKCRRYWSVRRVRRVPHWGRYWGKEWRAATIEEVEQSTGVPCPKVRSATPEPQLPAPKKQA